MHASFEEDRLILKHIHACSYVGARARAVLQTVTSGHVTSYLLIVCRHCGRAQERTEPTTTILADCESSRVKE